MVERIQTIRRQFSTNCLSVFDHFVLMFPFISILSSIQKQSPGGVATLLKRDSWTGVLL